MKCPTAGPKHASYLDTKTPGGRILEVFDHHQQITDTTSIRASSSRHHIELSSWLGGEMAPIKTWNVLPSLCDSVSSDNDRRLSMNINMDWKDISTAVKTTRKGGNVWDGLLRTSSLFLSFAGLLWVGLTTVYDCCLAVKLHYLCCSLLVLVNFESLAENIRSRQHQSSVILRCQGMMRPIQANTEARKNITLQVWCFIIPSSH